MALVRALALVLLLGVAAPASAEELTLSVAISMKDAIEELGRGFTQAGRGVGPPHTPGPCGGLGKQVGAGPPVVLSIRGGPRKREGGERRGLLGPGPRRFSARNVRAAAKPGDSSLALARPAD